jgi:hypothetical protein
MVTDWADSKQNALAGLSRQSRKLRQIRKIPQIPPIGIYRSLYVWIIEAVGES